MNNTNLSDLRCTVLGASGFIGTNLCESLDGKVRSLTAFSRQNSWETQLDNCRWIEADFSDLKALSSALENCDVVFHLINATTPASANTNPLNDLELNVASTIRMLDLCVKHCVKRIVFISSGGTVYGIPDSLPIKEDAACFPITAYGISKLSIERYLHLYHHLYDLDYRILRVSNPYGPHQSASKGQGVIAAFIARVLAGLEIPVWGGLDITRDYIYIDDVISAIELSATDLYNGRIFNIGSGIGYELNDIVNHIHKITGTPIQIKQMPGRKSDVRSNILDNNLAKTNLEWKVNTTLELGITNTIHWWMDRTGRKQ